MNAPPSILVACLGNVFLGDDGFGVEVGRRLAGRPQPEGVRVIDFGIRGLDLAYALLEEHHAVVLVDATARGGSPGSLYVLEPPSELETSSEGAPAPHAMDPWSVLRYVASLGGTDATLRIVGCEPQWIPAEDEDLSMELSAPVAAAVDRAVITVEALVHELREELAHA